MREEAGGIPPYASDKDFLKIGQRFFMFSLEDVPGVCVDGGRAIWRRQVLSARSVAGRRVQAFGNDSWSQDTLPSRKGVKARSCIKSITQTHLKRSNGVMQNTLQKKEETGFVQPPLFIISCFQQIKSSPHSS